MPKKKMYASQGKDQNNGVYSTPTDFIQAVEKRFGKIGFDLAASPENAKVEKYFTEEDNSLIQDWSKIDAGILWLNPPYSNIGQWAKKCYEESIKPEWENKWILLLIPASTGTNYFKQYIHKKAKVHFLSPRMSFDGVNPYPKDLILCQYGYYFDFDGVSVDDYYECWRWDR